MSLAPWERVQVSRKADRPSGSTYIRGLFTDFIEFHGDRKYGDDPAVIGGVAAFHGIPVTVIAQEKEAAQKKIFTVILECQCRKVIVRLSAL